MAFRGCIMAQWLIICMQCRRHRKCGFDPWVGRSPREGNGNQAVSVLLPEESHGQRSLVGYSPQGHKESGVTGD